MGIYEVEQKRLSRFEQGDVYKNIEYIENVTEEGSEIVVKKILFPYAIVLSQDCDLQQGSAYYDPSKEIKDQDKKLLSVIVAPLYNLPLFLDGEHLADPTIGYKMQQIPKEDKKGKETTKFTNLKNNEVPRYHYLEFSEGTQIPACVIDFKHFFTINPDYLNSLISINFIAKLKPLYRELVTQRFGNFLSRIGLP